MVGATGHGWQGAPTRRHRGASAALAVVAALGMAALAACDDDATPDAAATGATASSPAATTTTTGAPTSPADEQFTPVTMDVLSTPRWFTNSAGEVHVAYEVRITNAFPFPATVTEVEVRDAASGDAVQTLRGADLLAAMSLQPTGGEPTVDLAIGEVGVLWMDIPFDDAAELPAEITHTLTVTLPDDLPIELPDPIVSTYGRTAIDPAPPLVIGPPLAGPGWLAFGSCCDGPHRRALQPVDNELWLAQRYAIDFNRIDADDRLATGPPGRNESWPTYDQPVLAVADGVVVRAANDLPDQTPEAPSPVSLQQADGNYIVLQLDDGVFAAYAHLKAGTVTVEVGDTVTKGEVMAHTGNSGSTTGPHLHFQVMDQPSLLVANGLPYVFDTYTVTGQSAPIAELMQSDPQQPLTIDTAAAGPREDELPIGRDILEFAPAP